MWHIPAAEASENGAFPPGSCSAFQEITGIARAKRTVGTRLISFLAGKPLAGAGKGKGPGKRLPGNDTCPAGGSGFNEGAYLTTGKSSVQFAAGRPDCSSFFTGYP